MGEAGITLYTVGSIKDIVGIKKYVNIDGGMFDNPRFALYNAKYEAVVANRASESLNELVSLAGKCCESGDMIAENLLLNEPKVGDIIAVFTTGAYNYSMSSHYNSNFVPPVLLVDGDNKGLIVRPETYEDIVAKDIVPDWLDKE